MKRQVTIGEALMAAIMIVGAILGVWLNNAEAISTIQTKQTDDRLQTEQFKQDLKERLSRIENKIDKLYEKQTH